LFSPFSPQHSSFSESIASTSKKNQPVDTFQLAREEKKNTEQKIICIKEQMDLLSSEHYDSEEKNKAKEGHKKTYGEIE
jgi:outer membrane lipoprotein-sorting protein